MECSIDWRPASGAPQQLVLLLHGQQGQGADMAPLARALRQAFAQAALLAPAQLPWPQPPAAPAAPDVERLLEPLSRWVQQQQQALGATPASTCLAGAGEGAMLALALACAQDGIAGRVLAFGGGFASLPLQAPRLSTIHLLHGGSDPHLPAQGSRDAFEHLAALQGDATLDIADGVQAPLHPALVECALQRLSSHIPIRTWREALGGGSPAATNARQD